LGEECQTFIVLARGEDRDFKVDEHISTICTGAKVDTPPPTDIHEPEFPNIDPTLLRLSTPPDLPEIFGSDDGLDTKEMKGIKEVHGSGSGLGTKEMKDIKEVHVAPSNSRTWDVLPVSYPRFLRSNSSILRLSDELENELEILIPKASDNIIKEITNHSTTTLQHPLTFQIPLPPQQYRQQKPLITIDKSKKQKKNHQKTKKNKEEKKEI